MGAHPLGWLGRSAARWAIRGARARGGLLGHQRVLAHKARKNKKSFFLFIFYKLQTNLNSNQILIVMTSTLTIKYKNTSSPKKICNAMKCNK
jgi:hypothetical protein